jgi:hypothetical protein
MRETYEKRMEINEIIFIRTKILWNASEWVPYIWRTSSVFSVCLQYSNRINHTSEYARNFWACMLIKNYLPRRMPAYATVCDRAWNVYNLCLYIPLAYISVYRRMSDIFHTLAYASTIRNSVTGPLKADFQSSHEAPRSSLRVLASN